MNLIFVTTLLFASFVLVHIVLSRLTGPRGFMVKVSATFMPFLISPFVGSFLDSFFGGQQAQKWICAGILFSLFNMYVVALVCARNSVSLRIMDEMLTVNRGMTLDDLEKTYSERESVSSRLELMVSNGYLKRGPGEEIEISEKAKRMARITILIRAILGITNPG